MFLVLLVGSAVPSPLDPLNSSNPDTLKLLALILIPEPQARNPQPSLSLSPISSPSILTSRVKHPKRRALNPEPL